jgi:hypothetical protein
VVHRGSSVLQMIKQRFFSIVTGAVMASSTLLKLYVTTMIQSLKFTRGHPRRKSGCPAPSCHPLAIRRKESSQISRGILLAATLSTGRAVKINKSKIAATQHSNFTRTIHFKEDFRVEPSHLHLCVSSLPYMSVRWQGASHGLPSALDTSSPHVGC